MRRAQVGAGLTQGWRGTGLGKLSRGQWRVEGLGGHSPHPTAGSPLLLFPAARRLRFSLSDARISASPAWAPPPVWPEHIRRLTRAPRGSALPALCSGVWRHPGPGQPDLASPRPPGHALLFGSGASAGQQGLHRCWARGRASGAVAWSCDLERGVNSSSLGGFVLPQDRAGCLWG